ncbi:hypothetical protein ES708_21977 [subsurface metagenome]
MKRNVSILLIVLCILVISTLILFAEEVKYDFRKTNWGMSVEQVKATEKNKIVLEDEKTLATGRVQVDGKECIYVYYFLEDKLYRTGYGFMEKHTNKNLHIDDYEDLKEILTKKYGKPVLDKVTWKNDLFKNDKQNWGTAISIGHLDYFSSWETSTTFISLGLNGDNYKISLTLGYYSRELEEWAKKIEEERAKSEF